MSSLPKLIDATVIKNGFIDSLDFILCDCDGVLWNGNEIIPGSAETINYFKNKGKKVFLVTNNDTKTREQYADKCKENGFNVAANEIFTSGFALSYYLQSKQFQKKAYILGSKALQEELHKVGISSLPVGPDPMVGTWTNYIENLKLDSQVGAVIAGQDEQLSFPKLLKACSYLRNPDCLFLATSVDEAFPAIGNIIVPGTGPIVAAISNVIKRDPIICGKPCDPIFEAVKANYPDINRSKCIMIGDKLDSDILLGKKNNLKTLLVLTGTHNLDDIKEFKKNKCSEEKFPIPDYYIQSLGELGRLLKI